MVVRGGLKNKDLEIGEIRGLGDWLPVKRIDGCGPIEWVGCGRRSL